MFFWRFLPVFDVPEAREVLKKLRSSGTLHFHRIWARGEPPAPKSSQFWQFSNSFFPTDLPISKVGPQNHPKRNQNDPKPQKTSQSRTPKPPKTSPKRPKTTRNDPKSDPQTTELDEYLTDVLFDCQFLRFEKWIERVSNRFPFWLPIFAFWKVNWTSI